MTLHHEIRGEGPPVLLAGSLGTTWPMWEPQIDGLGDAHRLIMYDQLGHGRSPVPAGPYTIAQLGRAAIELLDALDIQSLSFVGVSIGGMVGQWLAAHHPERIDRLVLICTTAYLPPTALWEERARTVTDAETVEVIADAVVARWLTPGFAEQHPERVEALRAMLATQPVDGYAACCAAIGAMDQRKDLASIAAPTLVIGGAQDAAIPNEHQRALADAIPGARLELLDPGAHVVTVERADAVNRLIREHLEAP